MGRSLFLQALWGFQVTHVRVCVSMGPFGIPRVCKGTMDWGNVGDHSGKCHMSYRQNPKVEMLSRTWAPSVLGYPFVVQRFV